MSKYTPEQQQKIDGAHARHARMKAHADAHAERLRGLHVTFWTEWHRQGKTMADASRIMLQIESEMQRLLHAGERIDVTELVKAFS